MLGWATVEDVIDQYGEPSDRYENYNVTYELEGAEYTKHLDLTFYNGFLSGIVIQTMSITENIKLIFATTCLNKEVNKNGTTDE